MNQLHGLCAIGLKVQDIPYLTPMLGYRSSFASVEVKVQVQVKFMISMQTTQGIIRKYLMNIN